MIPRATAAPLDIPRGRRVLCISDVHAVKDWFLGVLERAAYDPDNDTLILLGDMVEKGADSLDFLHFLMEFVQGKDVRAVQGNCDHLILECAWGWAPPEHLWRYLAGQPMSLLWQMGRLCGFVPQSPDELGKLGEVIAQNYPRELAFIQSWPIMLADERAVFVHGGIPKDEHLEDYPAHKCMKNDLFLNQESDLKRWLVVGHTPVQLYRPDYPQANPVVDKGKHVISMDGGCAIHLGGQLNCLIFPSWGEERMEFVSYDGKPRVTARTPQAGSTRSRNIHWGEHQVVVLDKGVEFSRCRQLSSGYEMEIPNAFLRTNQRGTFTQDVTDYLLPVAPGDELGVLLRTSRGLLAKKDGVTGWYLGRFEET